MLLQCQYAQLVQDRGEKEAGQWMDHQLQEWWPEGQKTPPKVNTTVQQELWQDGFVCSHEDVQALQAAVKRAEKVALWEPPAAVQEERPGLFGGLFADEVQYQVDSRSEGYWMGISKNLELTVSTTADSNTEVQDLAKTIKVEHADGFDFVRVAWEAGKKDLDQQTYDAAGTIVIINSKEGLMLFGDQYPLGGAYEQAKADFENEDGIVFLGSQE